VAIVGASGSGKSTLLSIIAGLDTPTRGTVRLDGQDLFALDEDARAALRAQKVGFVFQSFQLMGNLTALENVMLPLELAGQRDARQRRRMLARGPGPAPGALPQAAVGRRAAARGLGAGLCGAARVLLADEPTGSLDYATGETIMELMFQLNREQARPWCSSRTTGALPALRAAHHHRGRAHCRYVVFLASGAINTSASSY
jgi:putative ABC transport system ATP-binding protein